MNLVIFPKLRIACELKVFWGLKLCKVVIFLVKSLVSTVQ